MARRSRYGGPFTPTRGDLKGQTFDSYFKYRQEVARREGFKSYSEKRASRARKFVQTGESAVGRGIFWQYGPFSDKKTGEELALNTKSDKQNIIRFLEKQMVGPDSHIQVVLYADWITYPEQERSWKSQVIRTSDFLDILKTSDTWIEITQRTTRTTHPTEAVDVFGFAVRRVR